MQRKIIIIAHNIRSAHNVGSLLRTCDGLGVEKVYLTGYTPYPKLSDDDRLPHIAEKTHGQIAKVSLGAESSVRWQYQGKVTDVIEKLKDEGFTIAGLEQTASSMELHEYKAPDKIALLLGEEVGGIEKKLLAMTDVQLEIPMQGDKESFNVTIAAALALYQFRFC